MILKDIKNLNLLLNYNEQLQQPVIVQHGELRLEMKGFWEGIDLRITNLNIKMAAGEYPERLQVQVTYEYEHVTKETDIQKIIRQVCKKPQAEKLLKWLMTEHKVKYPEQYIQNISANLEPLPETTPLAFFNAARTQKENGKDLRFIFDEPKGKFTQP